MYFGDHSPPHFHIVMKDGREALIELGTLSVMEGGVSSAVLKAARSWAKHNGPLLAATWLELHRP
jgi:deoxyhypusine synthase